MSIPRKVMMTSSTARTSVLGKTDRIKYMPRQVFILYIAEKLLKGLGQGNELVGLCIMLSIAADFLLKLFLLS